MNIPSLKLDIVFKFFNRMWPRCPTSDSVQKSKGGVQMFRCFGDKIWIKDALMVIFG